MVGEAFDAIIRRREGLKELQKSIKKKKDAASFIGFGSSSHLPQAKGTTPDTDELKKFHDELLDIDIKKRQQLVKPKLRGGGILRLSTVLIVFLLFLSGGLFFVGGYLFSDLNPPPGSSITVTGGSSSSAFSQKGDWREGTVIEGQEAAIQESVPERYAARRTYIERNENLKDDIYTKSENRGRLAAKREAKRVASKTSKKIESTVRKMFGATVANIFNPFARKLVTGTVGGVVNQAIPIKKAPTSKSFPKDVKSGVAGAAVIGGTAPHEAGSTGGEMSAIAAEEGSSLEDSDTSGTFGGDLYALEIQSFADSTDAFMLMRKLKAKGYSGAYMVRERKAQHFVYKVRVGNFAAYKDAADTRKLIGYASRVVFAHQNDERVKF